MAGTWSVWGTSHHLRNIPGQVGRGNLYAHTGQFIAGLPLSPRPAQPPSALNPAKGTSFAMKGHHQEENGHHKVGVWRPGPH